jgi:sugar lactone lactonase YvrE
MRLLRFVLVLLLAGCASRGAAPNEEVARFERMLAEEPSNTAYMYVLARYYDGAKETAKAVRMLTRLDEHQWDLGVGPGAFPNSAADPAFQRIAAKLGERETHVNRATEGFRFPKERKVRSEGIAYDPVEDTFWFSGGAAMLLRSDRSGNLTEVAVEPAGKKFGRLGMDVDAERRQIWVVNAVFSPDADADEKGRSGISIYDVRDGRLLRRVMRGSAEEPSFFNDLTLTKDGAAYITDTGRNEVVRLAPGADTFETVATDFFAPNGITLTPDEKLLYVADFRGINEIVLATGARRVLETSTPLNGVDGLIEHRGALIGIHNVLGRARVVRIHVQEANRIELLEAGNPLLDTPATGVAAGDDYFFYANKNQNDADAVILRIPLR